MALELGPDDLEAILAALPGDQPVGTDLREDYTPTSVYFRLRDARADARDAERQADSPDRQGEGGGGEEALQGKWRPVAELAAGALKESTKDLEIATWLTEALVRTAGLEGLKAGASVIGGLVERYWDGLFPLPEEGDMEMRVAAVAGLSGQGADGTLMQPLRKLPLFARPDGSPFCLWQYQSSLELSGILDPERREQRIAAGVVPFEDVEKEARAAGKAHWSAQRETLVEAMAAWEAMGRILDEKAGPASPSGIRVRDALQLMMDTCNRFAPATDEAAPAPGADAVTAPVAAARAMAPGAVVDGGPIAGREQALSQLEEIAEWFKRNEPNSPIGYTLDETVRRARMAWPELVAELIADEGSRTALLTSLGMKRPEPPAA
ncbi:MAG: type VI secretion system protein TssA [Reyranella sp.]|uniref:type VI secretion system protein TssA n=1 Tax=Reyranella sp. TaxID=1929291 RepID=UPI003D0B55EF